MSNIVVLRHIVSLVHTWNQKDPSLDAYPPLHDTSQPIYPYVGPYI